MVDADHLSQDALLDDVEDLEDVRVVAETVGHCPDDIAFHAHLDDLAAVGVRLLAGANED